jgi:K+-sensing histidine kinase KdpD
MQRLRGNEWAALLISLAAVGAAVLLLRLMPHVSATTVALALLLVVLGTATSTRLSVAIATSIAAMLALNYFFLPPVRTFIIADPQNWIAWFAFLAVAVIASKLSAAAQDRERQANERARLIAERDAAELARQKAEFATTLLASLSHDLRTPLTAIDVAIENLRGELSAEERRTQGMAAATEVNRLVRLVQDILDMARVDAGAILLDRQAVAPADVVDAALAQVQGALDGHPLNVTAEEDCRVEIDPRLASVALSHLLENAAQYSPQDGVIDVHASASGEGLLVTVTDHGAGVDVSELDHVFERFYRGRAARMRRKGTGMGLSITRGLLAAAGGRVWAENVRDGGACFSMLVPGRIRAPAAMD